MRDPDGLPVRDVVVALEGSGLELTARTDAAGAYRFDGFARFGSSFDPVGGLSGGTWYDPRKGPVHVEVKLRDPDGRFVFRYSADPLDPGASAVSLRTEVRVATTDIALTTEGECSRDITLGAPSGLTIANPPEPSRWRNLLAMYPRFRAAFAFARTGLGFVPRGEPLQIFPWCVQGRLADVDCPQARPDSSGRMPAGKPLAAYVDHHGSPYVGIIPEVSDRQATCPDDSLMHEVGHAVLTAAFRRGELGDADRLPHGGYYANASSNDAWLEGFADFFAQQVQHSLGRAAPTFVVCGDQGAASVDLETNDRAWDGDGLYEEFAAAGLLLDLVDGPDDYRSARVGDLTRLTVIDDPGLPRVVVGTVIRQPDNAVAVRVEFLDRSGRPVRSDAAWVDDRTGLFLIPVPHDLAFASVRAAEFAGTLDPVDDDPLHEPLATIWAALVCGRSARTPCSDNPAGPATMTDLYAALRNRFPGDRDHNGVEDVDQLFIDHGFHEDLTGDHAYRPGARPGMTSHPARGTHAGPAPTRYRAGIATVLPIRIVSSVPVRTAVLIGYPEGRSGDSSSYEATPGPSGVISATVPPESSHATVSIIALADGRIPRVVATLDPAQVWRSAGAPSTRAPLVVPVDLRAGPVPLDRDVTPSATAPATAPQPHHDARSLDAASTGRAAGRTLGAVLAYGGLALLVIGVLVGGVWLTLGRRTITLTISLVAVVVAGPALVGGVLLHRFAGPVHPAAQPPPPVPSSLSPGPASTRSGAVTSGPTAGVRLPLADVTASSTLPAQTGAGGARMRYDPRLAADGQRATAWCTPGDGTGQILRIRWVGQALVEAIDILPGYDKVDAAGIDRWSINRRITRATLRLGDAPPRTITFDGRRAPHRMTFPDPIAAHTLDLTIEATTAGDDTCLSEIAVYGTPRGI